MLNDMVRNPLVTSVIKKYGNTAGKLAYVTKHFFLALIMFSTYSFALYCKYFATFGVFFYLFILFGRASIYYIDIFPEKYEKIVKEVEVEKSKFDPLKMRPDYDIQEVLKSLL
jgi:hypothetical protein